MRHAKGRKMKARAKRAEGGSGAGLFEPDILLPNQYFAAFRRGRVVEGERRLMLAVLEDAVDSYRKYALARDPREQASFLEAREWFWSSDRSRLFAFENICDVLEMNADYLRSGLDRWRGTPPPPRRRPDAPSRPLKNPTKPTNP